MDRQDFEGRFLGVLGGMGPLAGATFMQRLVLLTPARTDQQHIPAVLWNDPRVPSRPAACLENGEDPLPWMANGVRKLESVGAQAIVIPCNTAHVWYAQLTALTALPILHIVEAVAADLLRAGVSKGPVGLMATQATLDLRLYQNVLEARGYECLVLEREEHLKYCVPAIEAVKYNDLDHARAVLAPALERLRERGAQAVVLGCTELPLAVPHAQRDSWGVPIVDSIDALARAAVQWYGAGQA